MALPPAFLLIFISTFLFIAFFSSSSPRASFHGGGEYNAVINGKGNEALDVGKFRFLLGFQGSSPIAIRKNSRVGNFAGFFRPPTPAPSPAPGPITNFPTRHIHRRAPPPSIPPTFPLFLPYKMEKRNQSTGRYILTVVLASAGAISICAIALFLACLKLKKHKKRKKKYLLSVLKVESGSRSFSSRFMSSQSTVTKVSSDPGADLLYMEESPESSVSDIEKTCPDPGNGKKIEGCSSFGEMISDVTVHEIEKFDDKIVYEERDSSQGSIYDSPSSHFTVSVLSRRESPVTVHGDEFKDIHCSPPPEIHHFNPISSSSAVPPPPPPPPPPSSTRRTSLQMHLSCPPHAPVGADSLFVPPPPPSLQQIPVGKNGCPLPKLKPLHWDKVRAASNRLTVWDKLRSSSFEFDEDMMESLFGYNLQMPMKNDEANTKTPSPSKHILEPKRLQNITILSKALNVTTDQVCSALIRGDGLSLQDLEALSKMAPTGEEADKLADFKGKMSELGSAEKLVKAMLQIPFAFQRVEAMLFRETFEDEVLHLRRSFSMLEEACAELRSSRLFLKLLEAVLKTGNRMNVGTIRGGAKAFKLDALLKLADVKGTDGKTTLLHFVVQEIIRSEGLRMSESIMGKIHQRECIEDKEENYRRMGLDIVSSLSTELCNAKKTASLDLEVLGSSVTNLSNGLHKIHALAGKDVLIKEDQSGGFLKSMYLFLKSSEIKLKELQEDEKRVILHVREITEYFHGDVGKDEYNPLRIFVIVRDFLSMLEVVCKELRSTKAPRIPNLLSPF